MFLKGPVEMVIFGRIADQQGNVTWMYESRAIVDYLQAVYAVSPGDERA